MQHHQAGQPVDRLTRVANELLETMAQHSEVGDKEQAIVLIRSPEVGPDGWEAGIGVAGIDDPRDAISFLLGAAKALAAAEGIPLRVIKPGQN